MNRLRDVLITLRLSAANLVRLNWNRLRGRAFVPDPRTHLFIEPTTHCNLACRFCTYRLHRRSDHVMAAETFARFVGESVEMGFARIALTPINGDVFVDKRVMDKLRHLETVPGLSGFLLYTNFIAASPEAIAELVGMKRLTLFNISVYGHDRASFEKVAGRGADQYRRLVDNLNRLADLLPQAANPAAFQVSIRTGRHADFNGPGDLLGAIRRLGELGVPVTRQSRCDDWGGLITASDMAGLDMELIEGRLLYKQGACILPFYAVQILADGRVNACACRDIDGQLVIGDLARNSLGEILSADNPAYVGLIERQQRGDFPPACRGCSFYRSIYDPTIRDATSLSLDQFWKSLGR